MISCSFLELPELTENDQDAKASAWSSQNIIICLLRQYFWTSCNATVMAKMLSGYAAHHILMHVYVKLLVKWQFLM